MIWFVEFKNNFEKYLKEDLQAQFKYAYIAEKEAIEHE